MSRDEMDVSVASGSKSPVARTSSNGVNQIASLPAAPVHTSANDVKGKMKAENQDQFALQPEEADLDPEEEILLGTIAHANIVGVDKFQGIRTLKQGGRVELRRDHVNISDQNAIEVRHTNKGLKIGMLAKTLAGKLAPLLDDGLIELEAMAGEVPLNKVGLKVVSIKLEIYGARNLRKDNRLEFIFPKRAKTKTPPPPETGESVEQASNDSSPEKQLNFTPDTSLQSDEKLKSDKETDENGQSSEQNLQLDLMMEQSILVEQGHRPSADILGDLFREGGWDPASLPIHPCPPGKRDKSMRTDLMDFQKQGLAWMIQMEHPKLPESVDDPPVQLWSKKLDLEGNTFYYNVATGNSQREKPLLKRGGILADEMGLGKTLQTIALICTDDTGVGILDTAEHVDERFDDMSLIVCPLSVASNWTNQFHSHVGSKRLKWLLFHGEGRNLTKKQLREYDVVIATYQTVAAGLNDSKPTTPKPSLAAGILDANDEPEAKRIKLSVAPPRPDLLHQVKWRRIVLDEGHVIKNPNAKMSKACASLKAERRWILTGTPIVNSATDLGAMMTFLRLCRPLDDRIQWRNLLGDGQNVTEEQAKLLRAVVASTTLRRTKDMTDSSGRLLVELPEIKFYLHKVKLLPKAQILYDELNQILKGIVSKIVAKGKAGAQYSNLLTYLLRLRQLACDPTLCPQSFIEDARAERVDEPLTEFTDKIRLTAPKLADLRRILLRAIQYDDPCPICEEPLIEPKITACEHVFCSECIEHEIETKLCCPICRFPLNLNDLVELEANSEANSAAASQVDADEFEVLQRQATEGIDAETGSAKTRQLIEFLKATEPGVKSLVFSQWTTHLNCIEACLERAGIVSCRFDGSMTQNKREEMIKTFSLPPPKPRKGGKPLKLRKGEKPPPSVMLISLKAGALGLNLTCASQVFLMDPWWQASIEQQAIDRVYRIGQTRPVRVFQLVAENTVEDRVLEVQRRKEKLISQAFSGNKKTADARGKEKIESRLADIEYIFGV